MKPRLSVLILGVGDLERSRAWNPAYLPVDGKEPS